MAGCESKARPEIGVQNSAGGVDDADVAGPAFHRNLRLDLIEDGVVIERLRFALSDRATHLIQSRAAFLRHVIAIVARQQAPQRA